MNLIARGEWTTPAAFFRLPRGERLAKWKKADSPTSFFNKVWDFFVSGDRWKKRAEDKKIYDNLFATEKDIIFAAPIM